ncbi:MFS transporter [Lentilactobacillus sp. Marseille-Q4993]|uniref:MFS transporter n=1 Tax=Lentilactobacillus sp. Marseille-Q4993 TaxID=3039492 RepID=UPI0024BCC700|nr:MFS transporter [Lentilactobacillus sp. Marseille-Q4993]
MSKFKVQTIIFVLVAFMLGCNEFMVVGVISELSRDFHVSISLIGYLVTIFATVYAVSTPFITILTSKYNRYKTLMTLMIIFLIGNTLSGFAPNYIFMLVSRVLTAFTAGSIISLVTAFASQIAPRDKRAFMISWITAGFSIASVAGVPIGVAISTSYGWRYAFFGVSVITVVVTTLLSRILPKQIEQTTSTIRKQLTLLLDSRIYVGIFSVLFTAAAMYSYYTYIRPLITTALGFSDSWLNWLLVVIGAFSIVGNRLSGKLAESPRDLEILPWFYVADIVLLSIMPFFLHNQVLGFGIILILTLIVTINGAPLQLHFINISEKDFPQSLVLASSLSSIFFNFGISLGSATSSSMLALAGLTKISWAGAVFAALSMILIVVLNRIIAKKEQLTTTAK